MKIIVGLGNPGEKYKNTRHNAGFMALEALAEKYELSWNYNKKFQAETAQKDELLLIKPQTYMNLSGAAVYFVLSYYKLLPKKMGLFQKKDADLSEILTVLHDDLDIELSKCKISINSRSAGHNGVQSIINRLKTKNFKRLRIGIKTELKDKLPAEKFVLGKLTEQEIKTVKAAAFQTMEQLPI